MATPAVVQRFRRLYYGWWIVVSNAVISFVGGFHFNGGSVYFLPISESLNLTRAQLSFVFAAARLEGGIEGPIIGWLVDRIGTRWLIMAGGLCVGAGYILLGLVVDSYSSLLLVYLILISTGASLGFFAPLMAAVNIWFVRRRTMALSLVNTFSRGSAFIVTPLLSYMVLSLGWQRASLIVGILVMVVVVAAATLHRRSPESMGLRPDGDAEVPASQSAAGARPARPRRAAQDFTVREALRTQAFWLLTTAQALRILVQGGLFVHLIPILVWKGMERQEAANLLGVMAIVSVPAVLLFGWAGDRYNKKYVIALGASAGALGLLLLALGTQTWHILLYVFLNGIADASFPVIVSISGDYFGRRSFATLRGISQFFTALGVFFTTIFAGWVYDQTESYELAILPLTLVAASAVPLFLIMRPPKPPASAAPLDGTAPAPGVPSPPVGH